MHLPKLGQALRIAVALAALSGGFAAMPTSAFAAIGLDLVGTYASPVYVTSDPHDAGRLFVVEKGGRIKLTQGGTTTTFLNISSQLLSGGERGLLSMAFAPDFATSGRFYVIYNRAAPTDDPARGDLQLDEFVASGDHVDPTTARHVLTIDHPKYANHNGGQLQFGPDGYLYISTGDGGGSGDPQENAQNTESLLGKILRIDPRQVGGSPYSVPADNPFVGTAGADEVWSYGLRNPGASPSTGTMAPSSSAMSAKAPGRRSITSRGLKAQAGATTSAGTAARGATTSNSTPAASARPSPSQCSNTRPGPTTSPTARSQAATECGTAAWATSTAAMCMRISVAGSYARSSSRPRTPTVAGRRA